jgi:hypothetical protein
VEGSGQWAALPEGGALVVASGEGISVVRGMTEDWAWASSGRASSSFYMKSPFTCLNFCQEKLFYIFYYQTHSHVGF